MGYNLNAASPIRLRLGYEIVLAILLGKFRIRNIQTAIELHAV